MLVVHNPWLGAAYMVLLAALGLALGLGSFELVDWYVKRRKRRREARCAQATRGES